MARLNRSVAWIGATALAMIVGGCAKHAASADPAAAEKAIKADQAKWNEQFKAKDQEGLLSHYADDAYFVAPDAPAANGETAIRKGYAEGLADHYFSVNFASDKIDVADSGDLAYSRGHFTETYQDPKSHQIVTEKGSYLTVYRKQQDGSWKAVEDFAAADPTTRTEKSAVAKGPKMLSSGL
jgi:uncharacterized protein (TIGR02246 family)